MMYISRNSNLTVGAWLSDRVLVSVAVRPRSFSPSSSALHPGRSASGFSRSTNVPDVRFHKTALNEFYRVAFRKKVYRSIDELQTDLDTWIKEYNETRRALPRGRGTSITRAPRPRARRRTACIRAVRDCHRTRCRGQSARAGA